MSVLLLSTYDLGRQPFGLASPVAWLREAGVEVVAHDLSRGPLPDDEVRRAAVVACYLPMHTATRLAIPVIDRVRRLNERAVVAAYGLYAPLAEPLLRAHGVSVILGPEAEADLVALAKEGDVTSCASSDASETRLDPAKLPRLQFLTPVRAGLPPLQRYAALRMPDGSERVAGATEATRGCKHHCRHCPIVPVYGGHFRVVPLHVVLADVEQQIAAGAGHITFGDPDFFNGPSHARRIVEEVHARHPTVTYDVTIKVEHLLQHRALLPILARTGCLFVTSAVESIDDDVLAKLKKGHTRADFLHAVALCRDVGLALAPTFVAFTPWTSLVGYRDLLTTIDGLGLIEHVAPVQWGLRLLITHGSRLLELRDIQDRVRMFDARTLTYPWRHDNSDVDALQESIMRMIGVRSGRSRAEIFAAVCEMSGIRPTAPLAARATIPYLNEPWYC